jgi:hypothetical protein
LISECKVINFHQVVKGGELISNIFGCITALRIKCFVLIMIAIENYGAEAQRLLGSPPWRACPASREARGGLTKRHKGAEA